MSWPKLSVRHFRNFLLKLQLFTKTLILALYPRAFSATICARFAGVSTFKSLRAQFSLRNV